MAATHALGLIAGRATQTPIEPERDFAVEFFSYQEWDADVAPCPANHRTGHNDGGSRSRLPPNLATKLAYVGYRSYALQEPASLEQLLQN